MIGIFTKLIDGLGRGFPAEVTNKNALKVTNVANDVPSIGTLNQYEFFKTYLSTNGGVQEFDTSASHDVSGSLNNPREFYLQASQDYDIYIMQVSIVIADSSVVHNEFGTISPLSNGWDLLVRESGNETYLVQKAKTGGQIIAQTGFNNPYGDANTSWELANWTGSTDALTATFPFYKFVPNGHRIGMGTNDRIISRVNDNLIGLNEMWVQVFGYKSYPDRG